MAAHVVVIDSTARRATVKTTPNKPLSDILEEGCTKLNLDSSKYGLKNGKKQLDLSLTIRLSGLSSGAKLELVQTSRSAAVVSVALQIPESEAQGTSNARLTDKFPSSTTLWLLLRKFEAGVAGSTLTKNFTARGAPSLNHGKSGQGRMYYEQPVIQVMGRELATFTDLQKTLAQLGFNSGSTLLRLSFRKTDRPLEEAMVEIEEYFQSMEAPPFAAPVIPKEPVTTIQSPATDLMEVDTGAITVNTEATTPPPTSPELQAPSSPTTGRPMQIFAPPTSTRPMATQTTHNESDYVPTIEHAQTHQRHLSQTTQNRRLPTDAEITASEQEAKEKLLAIKDVEFRIRFPDQTTLQATFRQQDTGNNLYDFVRECLEPRFESQSFVLRNPGINKGKDMTIPATSKKLITDMGLKGKILVIFSWSEKASVAAQQSRQVLKPELRQQATKMEVRDLTVEDDAADVGRKVTIGGPSQNPPEEGEEKKGVPKWLKGLAKK